MTSMLSAAVEWFTGSGSQASIPSDSTRTANAIRKALYQRERPQLAALLRSSSNVAIEADIEALYNAQAPPTEGVAKTQGAASRGQQEGGEPPVIAAPLLQVEHFVELIEKRWEMDVVVVFVRSAVRVALGGSSSSPSDAATEQADHFLLAALNSCVLRNFFLTVEPILAALALLHPAAQPSASTVTGVSPHHAKYTRLEETLAGIIKRAASAAVSTATTPSPSSASSSSSPSSAPLGAIDYAFVRRHRLQPLFGLVCLLGDVSVMTAFVEAGIHYQYNHNGGGSNGDADDDNSDAVVQAAAAANLRFVAKAAMRTHAQLLQRYVNSVVIPGATAAATVSVADSSSVSRNPLHEPEWLLDIFTNGLTTPATTNEDKNNALQDPLRVDSEAYQKRQIIDRESGELTLLAGAPSLSSGGGGPLPSSDLNTQYKLQLADAVLAVLLLLSTQPYPGRDVIRALMTDAQEHAAFKSKNANTIASGHRGTNVAAATAPVTTTNAEDAAAGAASSDGGVRTRVTCVDVWTHYERLRHHHDASTTTTGHGGSDRREHTRSSVHSPPVCCLLVSPVAALLAAADGPWEPDTHALQSPSTRARTRMLHYYLSRRNARTAVTAPSQEGNQGKYPALTETDIELILQFLPQER